ncbi:pentatricopeptide repeat-containing protein At4g25270, chloroplastic [Carica papaya]|uniref:pentatricopeptide repeat-containing protein At4g25270, chloroplastic n=1 Tax=Carica papaya TaxID=3649 RepID=UPI000B8D18B0|nr:pentatricopeptide repeat-containing protein At4g25270, chloroplastic [Carica papaya]
MVIVIQPPSIFKDSMTLHCFSRSNKSRKQKVPTKIQHKRSSLFFPDSSLTPLLVNHRPVTLQKLEALDAVVQDLEASVKRGIIIDTKIFASLLETCYHLKAIDHGIRIHRLIPPKLLRKNVGVSSKLLRLYAFCGHIENAHEVFDQMSKRNAYAFAWNSLSLMKEKYGIMPIMEHYACMVNLYGRAGLINEAYVVIIDEMEVEAGPTVWGALLYACYLHGNVEVGELAAQNLFELEPDNEHNFELLMKVYSKARRMEDVERVRAMMLDRGLEI